MMYQLIAKYAKKVLLLLLIFPRSGYPRISLVNKALFPGTKNSSGRKGIYNSLNFEGRHAKDGNSRNVNGSRPSDLDA